MSQRILVSVIVVGLLAGVGIYIYKTLRPSTGRWLMVSQWLNDPSTYKDLEMHVGERCGNASFIFQPMALLASFGMIRSASVTVIRD